MLFIDDVQMSPEAVATKFGVDLKKIKKYGVFEINPKKKRKDRLNGGFRVPAGKNIICSFWAKDPQTSKSVNIRYAQTVSPQVLPNNSGVVNVYKPDKVMFPGEEFIFILEEDRALFFYLSKDCLDSPFYIKGKPFYYYLQDKEKEARLRVESKGKLFEAMQLLQGNNKMSEDEMRVLAKGIGISGVDQMEQEFEIVDALIQKAEADPSKFITEAKSKNTSFYGTIQNLIDKQYIQYRNINGVNRWFWATGEMNGQEIVIVPNDAKPFDVLKAHIVDNAQSLYKLVYDLDRGANTDNKLNKFLATQEEITPPVPEKAPAQQVDLSARLRELEQKEKELNEREEKLKQAQTQGESAVNKIVSGTDDNVDGTFDETADTDTNTGSSGTNQLDMPLPKTFSEAVEYMTKRDGKRPTNGDAKVFLDQCLAQGNS